MPPQLQALLEDRQKLAIVGGALAGLLLIIILIAVFAFGGKDPGNSRELKREELVLATTGSIGHAIEIQALMARHGINLIREDIEGGKAKLSFERGTTLEEKDQALVQMVQSGLMDKNVGLEIFDKSDLTASREEKRIRLLRARNGELARLIRKIPPIQDATVFISMPEPSLFKKEQEPLSATVQVQMPAGMRLQREQVRSILNLMVGSIEELDASHIALSDTNGNVYNSVLPASIDLIDRLQERDRYMEDKVRSQLNNLLGQENYVVTVSTHLREAPKAEMELTYSPRNSAVMKSSKFNENMNAAQKGEGLAGGPTSSYVPEEIEVETGTVEQRSDRNYNRGGQEVEYNTGKKQTSEDFTPGMIQDISIAVTIKENILPEDYDIDQLKSLVARSASPIVTTDNVSILFQDKVKPQLPVTVEDGSIKVWWNVLPIWAWVMIGILVVAIAILLIKVLTRPTVIDRGPSQQEEELQYLRDLAQNQAQQIEASQRQTQQLMEQQQQQLQQLTAQQNQMLATAGIEELKESLAELQQLPAEKAPQQEVLPDDLSDDELQTEIKSWIETS